MKQFKIPVLVAVLLIAVLVILVIFIKQPHRAYEVEEITEEEVVEEGSPNIKETHKASNAATGKYHSTTVSTTF